MRLLTTLCLCVAAGCTTLSEKPMPAAASASAAARLDALLNEDLEAGYRRVPFFATARGVPGYNHLLPDLSRAAYERERRRESDTLARLRTIDPHELKGQDRVSYELLVEKMQRAVEGQRFPEAEALVISSLFGIQSMMPRLAETTPFKTAQDYRDYIQRIAAVPVMVDQTIERAGEGLKNGWMRTKPVVDRVIAAIDAHIVDNPDESTLLSPFKRATPALSDEDRAGLRKSARDAVAERYQPAMRRLKQWLLTNYRPHALEDAGLASLPRGPEYYDYLIRSRIMPGRTAREIHELGLAQVAHFRSQVGEIARQTGFTGSTDEFVTFMRTDPRFFFKSADAVLAAYRSMPALVDPQLTKLFHKVPRMPYAVRAMTPAEAASSTAANYNIGSLRLGTSGYFTINALGYSSEATWRKETLFLHEAVPGHHFQNARAAEIEGLHPWRSAGGSGNTAYGEGWALYAETLGFPMGFYKDPYQHYGHVQAQLFRAARLVVDTGIHLSGWSRAKAIDYLENQGGVDHHFAVSEVDRYFSNPSQALGYMMGELKFLELRARAEKALGSRFDVRDFHAVCIDNGPMPLTVLEKLVDEWIAAANPRV